MSRDLPEPALIDCQGGLHPSAVEGFHLFNARQYWKAHEALETAWLEEAGEIRHVYRGILQIAVTYLHITRANYPGAVKVYQRSKKWLDPFPEFCRGIHLGELQHDAAAAMAEVLRLGEGHIGEVNLDLLKPLVWEKTGQEKRPRTSSP